MRRRKPDVLLILALATGLGVLLTGYAQGMLRPDPAEQTMQQINENARKIGGTATPGLTARGESPPRSGMDRL